MFVTFIVCFLMLWGFFQFTTPSLPPISAADAVESVTRDADSTIDKFPSEMGTWKTNVEGYEVKKSTAVEKVEENIYLVIFTEEWQKGTEGGVWKTSYIVDRGSTMLYDQGVNMPPYSRAKEGE